MTNSIEPKLIIGVVQWFFSALAIPALIWAWTLSSDVKIQQNAIEDLEEEVADVEENALQLARLNANLENLKEKMDEIKFLLRN